MEPTTLSPRARTLREFRAMTDTDRARWVQSVLPDKFVDCPACEGAGCAGCVDTGLMSIAGARAWSREHEAPPAPAAPARPAPLPRSLTAKLDAIVDACAGAYGVTARRLLDRDRTADVAVARLAAMYLARELTGASWPALGRYFGREHTTVYGAHERTARAVELGVPRAFPISLLRTELAGLAAA